MKRHLLTLTIALFLPGCLLAQNAFYNAQFLATLDGDELETGILGEEDEIKARLVHFTEAEKAEVRNLILFLEDPFGDDLKTVNFTVIRTVIAKYNTYLNDRKKLNMDPLAESSFGPGIAAAGFALSAIPNLISGQLSLSDTSQSSIIDGITKYYAEEFRKAQTITYMKSLAATAGTIGELRILFPATYEKIKNADPSRFPDLGIGYKEVFNADLKNAWPNLLAYIEEYPRRSVPDSGMVLLKREQVLAIQKHDAFFPLLVSTKFLEELSRNRHPVEILHYLDNTCYSPKSLTSMQVRDRIATAIHGVNLLQSNLRDTSKAMGDRFSNVWIDLEQLSMLNTDKEIRYFVGCLYQQDQSFFNQLYDNQEYKQAATQIEFIRQKLTPLINSLRTIQEIGKLLKSDEAPTRFVEYLQANLSLLATDFGFNEDLDLSRYFDAAQGLVHIYDNIQQANYSNTVYYILDILNSFLKDDPHYREVSLKIQEYGGFMAEIINSEDSEELKETIVRYAAPSSSFIFKRTYSRTLSVTGQPGYFASYERLDAQDDFKFVSGITLPLGFEYTVKPTSDLENTRASFGLFLQLVDIGAVLNFRVDDETSDLPDKITLRQIFSPGGSLNYGFKNSPATFALGYQYTPELREITLTDGSQTFANGHRFFARLAWDIPLLNIARSKDR